MHFQYPIYRVWERVPTSIINVIQFYDFDKYALSGNITKTFGRHALKSGGEVMRNEGYFSGGGQGPAGLFVFVTVLQRTMFSRTSCSGYLPLAGFTGIRPRGRFQRLTTARGTMYPIRTR